MTNHYPLRDRRRRANRAALLAAAGELFTDQGLADTTLDQIAEKAGLHVQTLYRHFPTKQALASALEREKFEIALTETDKDTLSFWHDWVALAASQQVALDGGLNFMRYIHERESNPKLAAAVVEIGREYTDLLTASLAVDFQMDPVRDGFPNLVASMLWGGNAHAVRRWYEAGGEADLMHLVVTVADEVAEIVARVRTTDRV
jgi:AcrR family transcriptional regulator